MKEYEINDATIYKGVYIETNFTNTSFGKSMYIEATTNNNSQKYMHTLELDILEDSVIFTWDCNKNTDTKLKGIALINTGMEVKADIDSFKDFLAENFPPLDDYDAEYDINVTDRNALKEIIVIMEYVFNFDAEDYCHHKKILA